MWLQTYPAIVIFYNLKDLTRLEGGIMGKWLFMGLVVFAFLLGYFFGCGDEWIVGDGGIPARYVYEFSEANATGAGGELDCPAVTVGTAGENYSVMPMVIVYGNGREQNNTWRMVMDHTVVSEGMVTIDTSEYESHFYRVVVIK
jgi:hypothetical protein